MAIRVQKRKNRYNRARLKFVRGLFMRNFTALVVIAFVAASVFGLVRLYKFMMTSRYFAVKKINVFGTRHSYTDDIIVLS
ncbi:MAG: hypothetical protein N3B13_12460, partial [Deltaproteobacteria bacterium]|nr:hypothetical protein [Deltaproteobacteria bacterium]